MYRYEEFSRLLNLVHSTQTRLGAPLVKVDLKNKLYFYMISNGKEEKIELDRRDSERFQSSNGKKVNYHYDTRESTLF